MFNGFNTISYFDNNFSGSQVAISGNIITIANPRHMTNTKGIIEL